jgi:predicted transcriptional regulator
MQNEVLFSLKPQFGTLIESGYKNHEFRKYVPKIAPVKIWFYITAPISQLVYIAEIDQAIKYPQQIETTGYGNQDFNNGLKKAIYAFPIKHLYKLKTPLTLSVLKKSYGFTAPQGFAYMNKYESLYKSVLEDVGLDAIY